MPRIAREGRRVLLLHRVIIKRYTSLHTTICAIKIKVKNINSKNYFKKLATVSFQKIKH